MLVCLNVYFSNWIYVVLFHKYHFYVLFVMPYITSYCIIRLILYFFRVIPHNPCWDSGDVSNNVWVLEKVYGGIYKCLKWMKIQGLWPINFWNQFLYENKVAKLGIRTFLWVLQTPEVTCKQCKFLTVSYRCVFFFLKCRVTNFEQFQGKRHLSTSFLH